MGSRSGEGLRIIALAEPRFHVPPRPAQELDVLVIFELRSAFLELFGEVEVHLLTHEARGRPEAPEPPPRSAVEAGLLAELAPRRGRRLLALLEVPAGSSTSDVRAAARFCRTSTIRPTRSTGRIATEPGWS